MWQITNAVNVQTQSHAVLGEQAAAMYCLRDFSRFIETHNLNDEDTLLKLVGSVQHQNRPNDLADKIPTGFDERRKKWSAHSN